MPTHHPAPTDRSHLLADVGAIAAIVIALCSLGMTVYEARSAREHERIAVWPRLSQSVSDSAGRYTRTITNVGLGPAIVRTFDVRVDGVLKHNWDEVVDAALQPGVRLHSFYSSFGKGSVLLPGAHLDLLTITFDTVSSALVRAEPRIQSAACYCSLYDQCWIAKSDMPDPERVARCDDAATGLFGTRSPAP